MADLRAGGELGDQQRPVRERLRARRAGAARGGSRSGRSARRPSARQLGRRAAPGRGRPMPSRPSRSPVAARAPARAPASSSSWSATHRPSSHQLRRHARLEALERLHQALGRQLARRHHVDDEPVYPAAPERHHEHGPNPHARHPARDAVVERPAQRAGRGERLDLGNRPHPAQHRRRSGRAGRPAQSRVGLRELARAGRRL